jgi:ubiquitin carboxyl-terminal hydrolase 10
MNGTANGSAEPAAVASAPPRKLRPLDALPAVDTNAQDVNVPVRGIVNVGNTCYLNSVLQALLRCGPLYRLLQALKDRRLPEGHEFPFVKAMQQLVAELDASRPAAQGPLAEPLVPTALLDLTAARFASSPASATTTAAASASSRQSARQQEDAHEYLGFLLDGLHEDFLALEEVLRGQTERAWVVRSEEWNEVGPRQKTVHLLLTEWRESAISTIFGTRLRSTVRRQGQKPSVSFQPFLALPLDVSADSVRSVEEALDAFLEQEALEDLTDQRTQMHIRASKQVLLERLPPVLILLLKRFAYTGTGARKLQKHIAFRDTLQVLPRWVSHTSAANQPPASLTYRLQALLSHHGSSALGGHYTADVRLPDGRWLCFDDASVRPVPIAEVLRRPAYLLFYVRTPASKQQQ